MYREYEKLLKELHPHINPDDLASEVDKHFATWFENHVRVKLFLLSLFSFAKWFTYTFVIYRHVKKE